MPFLLERQDLIKKNYNQGSVRKIEKVFAKFLRNLKKIKES